MKWQTAALAVLVSACVNTQVTPLAGLDPHRAPTCPQAVKVFASMQGVDTPYVELAYLHSSATDPVADEKLIESMKEKAAEIGANGILFRGITETAGGVGLVSSAFEKKPSGEATAIWMPKDSAASMKTCADSTGK